MERLNRNSNSVLQNNGQAAVGSNVSNGNQAQLRFQNYRARFGRPYILNVPPQFQQPMYRPARHPWDGRVPPYPYHLQPQSTYFTNQFFPYPSTPVRPMVPRSEVFYTPQRVPYQVTTASRPPPPDSVLSYHQVPPSRPVITPVRGRARRQTEQRRDEQNPSMNPTPQGSAEEMGSRLTSPYDSNNSVTESIDLTRGSPDLMTASQPMPLQEYNWQTPAPEAQSEQVQTYQVASPDYNVQYIPVPQNQMSHHMVPPTSQMCGQELEPYQMPIYQPVVQRAVVGASEIIRHTEANGPGTTSFLSNLRMPSGEILAVLHTIQYFYTQPKPSSWALPGVSGEPIGDQQPASQELGPVHVNIVSTSSEQLDSRPQSPAAERSDVDNGRISGTESYLGNDPEYEERAELSVGLYGSIDQSTPTDLSRHREELNGEQYPADSGGIATGGEESAAVHQESVRPASAIARIAESLNSYAERVRQGRGQDLRPHVAGQLSPTIDPRGASSSAAIPRLFCTARKTDRTNNRRARGHAGTSSGHQQQSSSSRKSEFLRRFNKE
ncbi:uncharacterized protein [Halyomorpha halys]|uniref:uncharacterized protein isoform X6 n=1 Tax=Halyomorpha halys TaxID=286706 RepID=UPI0006D4E190|nr:uncharacterized protein LOC106681800 isoform X5 [Halyomorpha halys]